MTNTLLFLLLLLPWTTTTLSLKPPPIIYTIAGSDSGGGAGIQADLHAIHALGGHACTVVTCITAQNSVGVQAVSACNIVQAQMDALQADLPPVAIKVGMLGTADLAKQVARFLSFFAVDDVPIVIDPVMISTSGHRLLEDQAQEALVSHILPLATILTPNRHEAEALVGFDIQSRADVERAAQALLAMGPQAVLIKGGHFLNENFADDYLLARPNQNHAAALPRLCDASRGLWFRTRRYETIHTHGTGCTLSSSIASALGIGISARESTKDGSSTSSGILTSIQLTDACLLAKAYVTAGIHQAVQLGQGPGPVAQTCFPNDWRYFPSIIVGDDKDGDSFPPVELGRILPIVDSIEWVERLCAIGGISDIQLRIKNVDNVGDLARKAQAICQAAGVRLWINDDWQAALEANCFGVHVGQEDLCQMVDDGALPKLRQAGLALGISTHSYGELSVALGVRPSYISLGPIFATSSKSVQFDPQGLDAITKWRSLIPPTIPLCVIGGIGDAPTARDCRKAGADCVAVIGAVTQANDPATAVSDLNGAMMS